MIQEIILEYGKSILMVIGLMELLKKSITKPLTKKQLIIIQIILCLIAGILNGLSGWIDGFTVGLIVAIASKWGMLVSITTLFYQLLVKKIRDAGGQVKGE